MNGKTITVIKIATIAVGVTAFILGLHQGVLTLFASGSLIVVFTLVGWVDKAFDIIDKILSLLKKNQASQTMEVSHFLPKSPGISAIIS